LIYQRIVTLVLGVFSAFMIWGGGFFWIDFLPDNFTRTNTYTLYSKLPPPPQGPKFCPHFLFARSGIVIPCNYQPPFVWWLQHRAG